MPQMAPMWWFTLFMMFILSYYMFMSSMYFYNSYKIKKTKPMNMPIKNTSWKW